MNTFRTVAVVLLAVAVAVAVGYAAFFTLLVSADSSAYTATTTAEYDYDEVVAAAEEQGWEVRNEDSSGFHPDDGAALESELGPNYEVARVVYYHESGIRLDVTSFADEGITELVLFGPDFEPLAPDALPEAWLVDRIQLALGVDEATARSYVEEMRAAMDGDVPIPQTYANEQLQFAAVYESFDGHERWVRTDSGGQGWVEFHYSVDGTPTGELHFVTERATLTLRDGRTTYVLNVDRVDGIGVAVRGPAGMDRTDAELRSSVREQFAALGIPPEAADDLTFEYDPSVW